MIKLHHFAPLAALLILGACTTTPNGPSVLVLPGSNKNFDQFKAEDFECRQFASYQIGGNTADQAAVDSGVRSAAVGTVLGALVGAAVGGRDSAATGAGVGLLVGGTAGAGSAQVSSHNLQRRYDNSYQQCMYSKGNRIPGSSRTMAEPSRSSYRSPEYPVPPPGSVIR